MADTTGSMKGKEPAVRWRSWGGLSVVLFLLYGLFNFFAAIQVPLTLLSKGAGGTMGALIVSGSADSKVLGQDLASLAKGTSLSDFLVAFMLTMCMMMMAFAILQIAVSWFALRRGHYWAIWALALSDISFIFYFFGWSRIFSSYGVSSTEMWTSFGGFWIMVLVGVLVAAAAGVMGLRKARQPA